MKTTLWSMFQNFDYHQGFTKINDECLAVSRFACNTILMVDVSSDPTVSNDKLLKQKLKIKSSSSKQTETNIASLISQNGNSKKWSNSSCSSLVVMNDATKNTR